MALTKTQKNILTGAGVLGGGAIIYFVAKGLKKAKKKKAVNTFPKSTVTTGGVTVNTTEIARQLGIDLGYAYAWYDPRHATENDTKALNLIKSTPKSAMPQVALDYFKLYGRNLQEDCQSVLDDYSQVSSWFV